MNIPQQNTKYIPTEIPESVKSGIQTVGNTFENVKTNISESLDQFSDKAQAGVGASASFLQSNTIVAKFAFILFVIIGFIFFVYLGIVLISYFTAPKNNPYLIYGSIPGNKSITISQDPKQKESIPILRSNNQQSGLEYTWSVWLNITDFNQSTTKPDYSHIFNKGNKIYDTTTGLATVNNGPGMYLNSNTNSLRIIVDSSIQEDTLGMIDISNIPINNKWFNVIIRVQNTIVDVYINGTISNRVILTNIPKQNYDDVHICQNGGFGGTLSNLRYYSYALNIFDINSILYYGPNFKASKVLTNVKSINDNYNDNYLSNSWYSYNK